MTLYFTGSIGSDWTDTVQDQQSGAILFTNWTGNAIPTAADDVEIGPGSMATSITINRSQYQHTNLALEVRALKLDAGYTLTQNSGPLTVDGSFDNEGTYVLKNALVANGSTFVNNSQMTIYADTYGDHYPNSTGLLSFKAGTVTLSGTGTLNIECSPVH